MTEVYRILVQPRFYLQFIFCILYLLLAGSKMLVSNLIFVSRYRDEVVKIFFPNCFAKGKFLLWVKYMSCTYIPTWIDLVTIPLQFFLSNKLWWTCIKWTNFRIRSLLIKYHLKKNDSTNLLDQLPKITNWLNDSCIIPITVVVDLTSKLFDSINCSFFLYGSIPKISSTSIERL